MSPTPRLFLVITCTPSTSCAYLVRVLYRALSSTPSTRIVYRHLPTAVIVYTGRVYVELIFLL